MARTHAPGFGFAAKRFALGAIAGACVIAAAAYFFTTSPASPHLTTDRPVPALIADLGVVRPSSRTTHEFKLISPWSEAVELDEVSVSCSCITPRVSWRTLQPDKYETVSATYVADNQPGSDERVISLRFADGRKMQLIIRATVAAEYSTETDRIVMWFSEPGEVREEEFLVSSSFLRTPPVVAVVPTAEWLSVTSVDAVPVAEAGATPAPLASWKILLSAVGPDVGGEQGAHVGIELPPSESMGRRQLRIPVFRRLRHSYQLYPKVIALRSTRDSGGDPAQRFQITLVAANSESPLPGSLQAVLNSSEPVAREIDCALTGQNGRVTRVDITLDADLQADGNTYIELRNRETRAVYGRITVANGPPLEEQESPLAGDAL